MTDVPKNLTVILDKDLPIIENVTVSYVDEDGTQREFDCLCTKLTCPCGPGDIIPSE